MHKEIIYLAGPMTGKINYNFYNFFKIEKKLIEKGFIVVNPAFSALELCYVSNKNLGEIHYQTYFEMDICLLKLCDTILLLDGWEDSKGAKTEFGYAKENNYNILFEKNLCSM